MNRKTATVALVCFTLVFGSGCSLFVPPTQWVSIQTDNPTASIHVDGRLVGAGSVDTALLRNHGHTVTVQQGDKILATEYIGVGVSPTGVLDIIGGFFLLFPWLGILGPGFWDLYPQVLHITTKPVQPEVRP